MENNGKKETLKSKNTNKKQSSTNTKSVNNKTSQKLTATLKNSKQVFNDSGLQGKKSKVLKRDNANKLLLGLSAISLVLVMVVMGQFFIMESEDPSNVIENGTMINGVNVGGMDYYDAEKLIYDVFKEKSENFSLTLKYKDKTWTFDKDDFKVNSEIHTIIEEAQKRNEIVESYEKQTETLKDLQNDGASVNVAFNYIFVGLDEKIDEIIKEIEIEPVNSEIKFNAQNSNPFEVTEHKNGLRVNKEQLYFDINEQFNKTNNVEVEIKTFEQVADVTKQENLENTTQISTFVTYVSDSTGGRKSNVKKALDCFNGFVVEPNETVSFNKVTGPHTLDNGYKIATIIYNGRYVDGVGGGICQASTTLYNALLLADAEILEVHKHTLPVKYVPLAMDAMVSDYVADLKFKNVSDEPLYIQTVCDSESVRVNIYGKKLDKEIKTRSETLETIKHTGDKIVPDTNKEYSDKVLFKGEQYRLTYPRNGYEAKAYVEYYVDGKKVEEKEIRHEIYKPQNGIVVEGVEDVPAGMNIIDGKVETVNDNASQTSLNNAAEDNFIPTMFCP